MATDHELLLGALLSQLSSNQASVRKKTVSCIGKTMYSLYNGCSLSELLILEGIFQILLICSILLWFGSNVFSLVEYYML